jgi:hypothetical protein
VEVLVDILCLCSLAESKATAVLVDARRLRTPGLCTSRNNFSSESVPTSVACLRWTVSPVASLLPWLLAVWDPLAPRGGGGVTPQRTYWYEHLACELWRLLLVCVVVTELIVSVETSMKTGNISRTFKNFLDTFCYYLCLMCHLVERRYHILMTNGLGWSQGFVSGRVPEPINMAHGGLGVTCSSHPSVNREHFLGLSMSVCLSVPFS